MFPHRFLGVLRRYKSYSTLSPIPLIENSLHAFRRNIKDGNYDNFGYDLIRKNFDEQFFKQYDSHFFKSIDTIGEKLVQSQAQAEQTVSVPTALDRIFDDFVTPTEKTSRKLIEYAANHPDDLSKLPVPGRSPQDVSDYIIERLVYDRMKPLNLQYYYNDTSNIQNFNKNLTLNIMDIDHPYEWFPEARKLKRKFIMHVGPTNSGKTYHALKCLENCSKGYFAGPLRLLAREVYDKFQAKGVHCNLVTGEEVIIDVDKNGSKAGLTSGTIEMLSMNENYDIVVVDEIQMLGDEFRGSAWTNAILGARAKEIHLCGEVAAVPLVKKLIAMTGDDLEINEYTRLGKLTVDDKPVPFNKLQRGDCVVCFSKTAILDMKLRIENTTDLKCAVIYGALPPETRAQEAQRFNDGYYDIVVASDAIGMGLNLKINRVIFTKTKKYNGRRNVFLTSSNVKQIGGRAGRFGVGNSEGHISAMTPDELQVVKESIEKPTEYLEKAYLSPPEPLWVRYYSMFTRDTEFLKVYRKFESDIDALYRRTPDKMRNFAIQRFDDAKLMSQFLHRQSLERKFYVEDLLSVLNAPTTLNDNPNQPMKVVTEYVLKQFMETIATRARKSLFDFEGIPFYLLSTENITSKPTQRFKTVSSSGSSLVEPEPVPAALKWSIIKKLERTQRGKYHEPRIKMTIRNPVEDRLVKLEQFHKLLSSYMWLSYRFPQNFVDNESAVQLKEMTEFKITEMLDSLRTVPKKTKERKYD